MIIVPQNKKGLISFTDDQNFVISFRSSPYVRDIPDTLQERQLFMEFHSGRFYELGLYKGDERCKQIVQEISEYYASGLSVYSMPKK